MGTGFFTGYRRNIIQPTEILVSLKVPKTMENQYFVAYKQAKRRDDDIAIVNLALNVLFEPKTEIVKDIQFAYGGMAPTVVLAPKTTAQLIGKKWDLNLVELANTHLIEELPLDLSAPGGMILYRRSLTLSLFFKAYLEISQELEKIMPERKPIPENERSGAKTFQTLIPESNQIFEKVPGSQSPGDPVGKPMVHASAYKQATGEAVYCDDMPRFENELYLALVLSTKAHAKIVSIDPAKALQQPGVHAFFSAKDLDSERNKVGPIDHDDEVFASEKVVTQGQVIGAIVADNQTIAQRASRLVKVEYEDIHPIIITIEDAIAHKSFLPDVRKDIDKGDINKAFAEADVIVDGEFRMGGQEHFYLETNATIAVPRDPDELEVFCSTQHPTENQKLIAHVTGLPAARVVVRTKRMGGGFGGKESRTNLCALPVALAAHTLKRPIRCMLDRDEDMAITGTRHPFYFKYKAAATRDGKITGLDIEAYNNGGCSKDLSPSVLERAVFHVTNSYFIPNVKIRGKVCRTNLPSNTAFRGFGGPQGMMAGEHIVRDIARALNKDYTEIVELNLYAQGDTTPYCQELINCNISK